VAGKQDDPIGRLALDGRDGRTQGVVGGQEGRMIPEVEDGLSHHVAQVVEVHDHAERVQRRARDRHFEVIGVAMQPRALARMAGNTVRRVKDVAGGEVHEPPEIVA
jgi:hypothetical protein